MSCRQRCQRLYRLNYRHKYSMLWDCRKDQQIKYICIAGEMSKYFTTWAAAQNIFWEAKRLNIKPVKMKTKKCVWKENKNFDDWKICSFIRSTGKWICKDKTVNIGLCSQMKETFFIPEDCWFWLPWKWAALSFCQFVSQAPSINHHTVCRRVCLYLNMLWKKRTESTENPQVCLCLSICQTNRHLINWFPKAWNIYAHMSWTLKQSS